jgi:alpha-mannosidase
MRTRSPASLLSIAAFILAATAPAAVTTAGQSQPSGEHALWKLGARDGASAEFALAPGGYASYRGDGFFVVGRSDPKRDWPYVQPGPDDGWAGSRSHTFSVVFGVKARPSGSGTCTLEIALVDTQSRTPPELKIELNGRELRHRLAPGGGMAVSSDIGWRLAEETPRSRAGSIRQNMLAWRLPSRSRACGKARTS